jgi:hypothetical protein
MCECVDCKGKSDKLYKIILSEWFDNEECVWCEDCLYENIEMVKEYKLIKRNNQK